MHLNHLRIRQSEINSNNTTNPGENSSNCVMFFPQCRTKIPDTVYLARQSEYSGTVFVFTDTWFIRGSKSSGFVFSDP